MGRLPFTEYGQGGERSFTREMIAVFMKRGADGFRNPGLRAAPRRRPRQVRPVGHPRPRLRWWSHFPDLVRHPPVVFTRRRLEPGQIIAQKDLICHDRNPLLELEPEGKANHYVQRRASGHLQGPDRLQPEVRR